MRSSTEKEKSNRTVLYNTLSTMSINQLLLYMQKKTRYSNMYITSDMQMTPHL